MAKYQQFEEYLDHSRILEHGKFCFCEEKGPLETVSTKQETSYVLLYLSVISK